MGRDEQNSLARAGGVWDLSIAQVSRNLSGAMTGYAGGTGEARGGLLQQPTSTTLGELEASGQENLW